MINSGETLGRFQAFLGLNTDSYVKGIVTAEGLSRTFGDTFSTFVVNPLLGAAELFKRVGRAAVSGTVEILANAEAIERLSQVTGASEPLLIALEKRLEIAGFTAERARQSFLVFNKFIDDMNKQGPLATDVLTQLNLSMEGLSGFDEIFRVMVQRLSEIQDPATKAGIAMKLFGEEAGHDLLNAIGGGNEAIDEMINQYTRLGFVVDRSTNTHLAALNTNLGFMQQAIEGVQNQLFIQFLLGLSGGADVSNESIIQLVETLNEELAPALRSIGELLKYIFDLLGGIRYEMDRQSDMIAPIATIGLGAGMEAAESWQRYIDNDSDRQAATRRNRERGQEYLLDEIRP